MDVVLTVVFYGCAVVAVGGALAAALAPAPPGRLLGLLGVAVGAAGLLLSLEAGFAALLALVCLAAGAILLGGGELRAERAAGAPRAGAARAGLAGADLQVQIGAAGAVLLLVLLLVIAIGGSFVSGAAGDGPFAAAAIGRALFGRDALATEAVGVSLLVALAALAWSRRP